MYPVLFIIGSLTFYTHGLLAVVGIALGAYLTFKIAKKYNLSTKLFFDNIVYTVLFGIIGARISYFILYRSQFASFKDLFYIWDGGLVSYGGFLLGGLCLLALLVKQREPIGKWFDAISIGFFLGLFIGRIGDLFAGEYNGVYSERSIEILKIYNVVPVSLYEAFLCLAIFALALLVYSKSKGRLTSGFVALLSIIAYSLGRFVLDFWRTESNVIFGLSIGQLFGLSVSIIASILLIRIFYKRKENV